ncbi:MAG: bifunctional DNA-formamidopyrimidine glycosylase/DNA-(apurinic or apyrimidinic site) lyase, partial [Acidobacteriales bacterium]|nr:bifunctional DNA-formamidopyrimidine glycosylase/DNA-(apurinic or apyrimidinic site) lyase [Terriglobales bacterium]
MPELPEVETIARGVDARVRGDRIVEAWFGSHREPFKNSAGRQAKGLLERRIESVHRTGKHIVVELGPPGEQRDKTGGQISAQWIVHLGMTGRLLVTTPDAAMAKHTHARLRLESGRELRFVDPRRFGRLQFRDLAKGNEFGGPGAEPLTIGGEEFAKLFRGRKLAIKAALLNQTLLAGVGNIYADESLFRAGIRPRKRAGKLTRVEL